VATKTCFEDLRYYWTIQKGDGKGRNSAEARYQKCDAEEEVIGILLYLECKLFIYM
jgi:hypothetical protein